MQQSYLVEMCNLNNKLIVCDVKLVFWYLLDAIQFGGSIGDALQLRVILLNVEYLV